MDHTYTYFLMSILFLLLWIIFYYVDKPARHEMLLLSSLFAIFGPITNFLYIQDWWSPISILGPEIGYIESLVASFGIVGVSSVASELVLGLRTVRRRHRKISGHRFLIMFLFVLIMTAIFLGSFYIFGLNSFIASLLALGIPIIYIWIQRRDLISVSLINGLFTLVAATLIYSLLEVMTPGWVEAFYHFNNTPEIVFLSMPIDDAVFYVFVGVFLGMFYEWWKDLKRVSSNNK